MLIGQSNLIQKTVDRFGMSNANPVNVPENIPYRQLIGSLLFISLSTRPDVTFAVNYLSQFQNSYSKVHFERLKRVLRYLKCTLKLKLKICCQKTDRHIVAYVDANWATDED